MRNRVGHYLDDLNKLALLPEAREPAGKEGARALQKLLSDWFGGKEEIPVDFRLVAATNRELEAEVARGAFRQDLYYRLNVIELRLPRLRQRREDIELLARHFVRRFAAKLRRGVIEIADDALSRLREYDWPGNVRELQNVIERAVILSAGATLEQRVLGFAAAAPGPTSATAPQRPLTLAEAERQAILAALEVTGWRISGRDGAAGVLGLKPTTLHAKMKKLGIRRPPRPAPGSSSGATTA